MDQSVVGRARKMISEHPNSVLITVDEAGRPVDRVMWTARVDDDMTVYYVTSLMSAKIKRIEANPSAMVVWIGNAEYLALNGIAEVTTDRELLDGLWRDSFARYFPGGRTDPNYCVIKITPREWACRENCDAAIEFVDLG